MIDNFADTDVVVTGAAGFIGSHLAKRLLGLRAKVHTLIHPRSDLWRLKEVLGEITIWKCDLTKGDGLKDILQHINPVKVFHLAAYVDVNRSLDLVEPMIQANLLSTARLIKTLRGSRLDCFINTGTCEEYGDAEPPFTETQRECPTSPYSASKVAATHLCQMLWKTERFPNVVIRPFLTYGPYQDQKMFIPALIMSCLKNQKFSATAGQQTREFNYIDDIVEGYAKAAIKPRALGEVINLGNGQEYPIREVASMIMKLTGRQGLVSLGRLPYRPAEAMHFYSDSGKAKDILDWEAKVDLEEGLKRTIAWYKSIYG